jgi:hypothetical protein
VKRDSLVALYVMRYGADGPVIEILAEPLYLDREPFALDVAGPINVQLQRHGGRRVPLELMYLGRDCTEVYHWAAPSGPVGLWPGDSLHADHWPEGTAVFVEFHRASESAGWCSVVEDGS